MRRQPLSERVLTLYVASQETMGLPRVRELTASATLTELHLPGTHAQAVQSLGAGERAHDVGVMLDAFLL